MRRIAIDLTAKQAEQLKSHFLWAHKRGSHRALLAQVYGFQQLVRLPIKSEKIYIGAYGTVLVVPLDGEWGDRWRKRYLVELKRVSRKKR